MKGKKMQNNIKIFNNTKYKKHRQELRTNMSEPERRLWQILRNKQMGVKFRRQHGIGKYIVDFYSSKIKLIIEVDGDSHFTQKSQDYDKIRDDFMYSLGIKTIRIKNSDILENIDGVYEYLKNQIDIMNPL